jgi:Putative adipose-regulatory protein (Seipin).
MIAMISAFLYSKLYSFIMPEIFQTSVLDLYSEKGYKEGVISIGENIVIEEERYNIIVFLKIPEIQTNFNIPEVNIEVWAENKIIGKGYRSLKKYENPASYAKKFFEYIGILFGIFEDTQVLKIKIPVIFKTPVEFLTLRIYPNKLQIEEFSTIFEAKLTGVKFYLNEYFYISYFLGVFWIFVVNMALFYFFSFKTRAINSGI